MNDLVFTVPAKEWTVEEFDRQVRGFKAKLVAFGDVFITAPVTEAKPEPVAEPVAHRFVPSSGSTAMSTLSNSRPLPPALPASPTFSPM